MQNTVSCLLKTIQHVKHVNASQPTLQWRHNKRDGVSNHRRLNFSLNCLCRLRTKKISKLHVNGPYEGNPSVPGGFPSQRASNVEMFPFNDVITDIPQSLPNLADLGTRVSGSKILTHPHWWCFRLHMSNVCEALWWFAQHSVSKKTSKLHVIERN